MGRELIAVHCASSVVALNDDLANGFKVTVTGGGKWEFSTHTLHSVSAPAFRRTADGQAQVCVTVRGPVQFAK